MSDIYLNLNTLSTKIDEIKCAHPTITTEIDEIMESISKCCGTKIYIQCPVVIGYGDKCEFYGIFTANKLDLTKIEFDQLKDGYVDVRYVESSCSVLNKIQSQEPFQSYELTFDEHESIVSQLATPYKNYQKWFDDTAMWLLNGVELISADHTYRLAEIEFYVYDEQLHRDTTVHRSAQQTNTCGEWYFHREKSAKIGFTLKGLDITIGRLGGGISGGILIRSIMESGKIIEGPSKVVDEILRTNEVESVTELKLLPEYSDLVGSESLLYIEETDQVNNPIFRGSRIGLNATKHPEWFNKPYRYAISGIKKAKQGLTLMSQSNCFCK
jgi:hypothetical protein